jgi:hypothetical protein
LAKKAFVYDGTNWIDIAQSTADLSNYANLTTNQPSFRNVLTNGAFTIDQRNAGASQTITAGAALAYTVDRWYAYCTGANITGARVAGAAPSRYYYRFTGATSNTAVGFGQRIETDNSFHLAGREVTLSVNIASTSLTSITWTAFYANTADTFGTLASPTRTQIATGTFAVTSTLGRKSATFTVPSAATTGIEIVFTGGALLGSQTLTYDDAQLELGSIATPFEQRPIGTELALCQRYFSQDTYHVSGVWGGGSGDLGICAVPFKVTMRDNPVITRISGGVAGDGAADRNVTSITTNQNSKHSARVLFQVGTSGTVGRGCDVYNVVLSLSAEL